MKYQCDKGHTFSHTAKLVTPLEGKEGHIAPSLVIGTNPIFVISSYSETAVCPICHSLNFSEAVEVEADIVSVKSVPLEEVDGMLAQGYKVRELYAKAATLVKLEAKA